MRAIAKRLRAGRGAGVPRWALAIATIACLAAAAPAAALPSGFGTEGSGAGQISVEPRGIAISQEGGAEPFIADRNNSRVDVFGEEGSFLLAWGYAVADGSSEAPQSCTTSCFGGTGPPFEGSGTAQFEGAEGIAVDNDPLSEGHGDIYLVDVGNHRVQVFGAEGKFLLMFGGQVNKTKVEEVGSTEAEQNICTAASGNVCQKGVAGPGPGSFEVLNGRSIAIDTTGAVYVGDQNRVQKFSSVGVLEGEVALPGVGAIENLAVDSSKDLYVAGSPGGGSELAGVHEYDQSGTELGAPRDEAGRPGRFALAIGPGDELFVNDFREGVHHILAYDPTGVQTASFDAGGAAQDGVRGIAYSEKAKALYILNPGSVRIVTPPPPGPLVLSGSETATELLPSSATLGAMLNPEGKATSYRFEYGTTSAYGEETPETPLTGELFEDQPASAAISGLQPGTTYHFRVVATNSAAEVTDGPDQTFTTLPPVSIDGASVTQVSATSARLEAELNPHGLASEYRFEYDTRPYLEGEGPHGTSTPVPDASAGSGTVDTTRSALLQGLVPSTTYYYRVIAHNSLGTVEGPGRSFITQGAAAALPDGRTWEMVSPANKHGAPLEALTREGGMIQSAAAGGAFAYVAIGPTDTEPQGNRSIENTQLLAKRGSEGWSTQNITTPHEEITSPQVGHPSEYKLFSEDLSESILEPAGATPLSSLTSERTPYRREADGTYAPLVTSANVLPGVKFGGEETPAGTGQYVGGAVFITASPDADHVVFHSPQPLTPGFKAGFVEEGRPNLYEQSEGRLQLISVLPSGGAAAEAGLSTGVGNSNLSMRGAISVDGGRVVFEANAGSGKHLYSRDTALGKTAQLDELQPGASGGFGEPAFQGASADGGRVLFTDASRLTKDATAAPSRPDLYLCEIAIEAGQPECALSDLTVDTPGEAANVQGEVSAFDEAGENVYFAANGVLTSAANARGEKAVPGDCASAGEAPCNLYHYDTTTRRVELVAVVSSLDAPDWDAHGQLRNLTARTSSNGRYFAFMSERSLTGYDNRDANSGAADEEVFLFDAQTGALHCVSCDPSGARPQGLFDKRQYPGPLVDRAETWPERWLAGSIPGWTSENLIASLYQSRYLSNSGRMFFNAADALAPLDTNGVEDVYQYEPPGVGDCASSSKSYATASSGCVNLISSGSAKEESAFLDASENGEEVFFLTPSRLLSSDVDSALDVYDAHVCSASSPCPPPPPPPAPACEGDACQNPSPPPSDVTPGSLTYKGPGNAVAVPAAPVKAKPLTRAQLLARALTTCRKDKSKKKRIACEKRARAKYGAKKATKARKPASGGKASRGRGKK